MHSLKAENYVLFGDLTEDYSPGYSFLDICEGLVQRGKGGPKIYRVFCWKKIPIESNIKDYC